MNDTGNQGPLGPDEEPTGSAGQDGPKRATEHRSAVRRLVWSVGIAVAATAAMIAVTVPLNATGDDHSARDGASTVDSGATGSRSPAKVEAAPEEAERGEGRAALTEDERAEAERLALAGDRTLRAGSKDVRGDTGEPEHLSTDLTDSEGEGRSAEVLFYDYEDDALSRKTVDLTQGKVEDSDRATGTQPPPSWAEAHAAATLLLKDPLGAGLREDFAKAAGEQLTKASQLSVQGLVYVPRGTAEGALADCGEQRCVRLFTRARGGPWIDTQGLVVNLSDRSVHRLPT